jgi:uncharacterized membrane protein YfcA
MSPEAVALVVITFVAAIVNGALGYGFSSITVPIALFFYTNRILNPSLVLLEVALNSFMLWNNSVGVSMVWRRVLPILIGLAPGVVIGTSIIYLVSPEWIKFATFLVLCPLILLQAAGIRRPIKAERPAGLALGTGVGVLYSVTTISGPPLALMFNNQGFAKNDFRAALALVRLAESSMTAVAYFYVGMFTVETIGLAPLILPSVILGIPLGAWIIRRVRSETFRRVCMSFDAWIVGFGTSKVLIELNLAQAPSAYLFLAAVGAIDILLLYRFFTGSTFAHRDDSRYVESLPVDSELRVEMPTVGSDRSGTVSAT